MNTLIELEDQLIEKLKAGRARGETFEFTCLRALADIAPQANDPAFLAGLYSDAPYTLDQFDEGGKVSELLYHNVRRHLTDFGRHWKYEQDGTQESNVVHPTEWR